MKLLFVFFTFATMLSARAQYEPDYNLDQLDVLHTCARGTVQETNARMAIGYMNAHKWWNLRDQMGMHHPEYQQWHGTLAGVIAVNPASNESVPFRNGVITNANFVKTFATVAYLNDITKYTVTATRLDCLGDDTVILVSQFKGFQVKRDVQGCITHGLNYGSPGNFQFRFKDYQSSPEAPVQRKVYQGFSHLDADYSIQVKTELARLAQGPANVEMNLANCKTYPQILGEFEEQIEQ